MGMAMEYTTKKESIIDNIERIGFENGIFVTSFDFSVPEKFEKFIEDTKKFLDAFSVSLLIPTKRKFLEIWFIKELSGNTRKGVYTTILPKTYDCTDCKPVLRITLYFNFKYGIPKNKDEVIQKVREYCKDIQNIEVVRHFDKDLADYLEVSLTIRDFQFDYLYSNLF
jgi:uncharacterized protein YlzI (FlbEa/FlbD family)